MKVTPEDMDAVRNLIFEAQYRHQDPEQRDTALALILVRLYDRGYNQAVWEMDAMDELTMANTGQCPYTHSHTRHWCGYAGCRDS